MFDSEGVAKIKSRGLSVMKFGFLPFPDRPVLKLVKLAKLAEDCEFDFVWIPDENPSPPCRDIFVALTSIAMKTRRIKLGANTCNPYTRHPALLATAISSLHELSRGRTVLGLGPGGGLCLKPLGIKMWEKPLSAVRESVKVIRQLFTGKTVDFEGKVITVKNLKLVPPPKTTIPIYLAARSPKMLELVGEIADGALLTTSLEYLDFAMKRIKEGAEKSGRDLTQIDIVNRLPFAIAKNGKRARELVRAGVGSLVNHLPPIMLEKTGIDEGDVKMVKEEILEGKIEKAAKLVTNDMIDAFSIAGTPKECIRRLEEFMDAGMTQLLIGGPSSRSTERNIKEIQKEIITKMK